MIWGILVLALIFRLININQSIWLDEAAQLLMSQKSLYTIIFERSGDFHPPLSYILYHFWMMVNQSEVWLRLMPVIFGVATVFVVYRIAQKLFGNRVAMISALLFAIAPYHIYYSQEIRMYSMATFFASLSMYYFMSRKNIGYVIATSALVYTHYIGFFLLIAQIIYKRNFKLIGFILLIYIPWLPFLWKQLQNGVNADQYLPGWGSLLSLEPFKAIPLTFLKFGIGRIDFENIYVYLVIAVIVLGFYSFLLLKAFSKEARLIWFWLGMPIISVWLISFILPMNQPFRLLFVLPAFYILLAVGIKKAGKYWKVLLSFVLIISLGSLLTYYINPRFHREDWRTATKEIPMNAIFAWPVPFDPYIWYGGKGVGVINEFPKELGEEVYLFEYLQPLSDPNHYIQKWLLDNGYKQDKTLNYNGVGFVYKYTK
jgi:uncharacterized membrane protein